MATNEAIYTWNTYRTLDGQPTGVAIKASPGQIGGASPVRNAMPAADACAAVTSPPSATKSAASEPPRYDPRTRALIEGPIAPTLIRLAAPNVLQPYDVLKHDLVLLSKDAATRLNHSLDPESKPVVVPDVAAIAPAAKPAKKEAAPKAATKKLTTKKPAKPKTKKGKG